MNRIEMRSTKDIAYECGYIANWSLCTTRRSDWLKDPVKNLLGRWDALQVAVEVLEEVNHDS